MHKRPLHLVQDKPLREGHVSTKNLGIRFKMNLREEIILAHRDLCIIFETNLIEEILLEQEAIASV